MDITSTGKLSLLEVKKSLRDILIIGVATVIPPILELAPQVDFGKWTGLASISLAIIAPLANRWLNGIRISK